MFETREETKKIHSRYMNKRKHYRVELTSQNNQTLLLPLSSPRLFAWIAALICFLIFATEIIFSLKIAWKIDNGSWCNFHYFYGLLKTKLNTNQHDAMMMQGVKFLRLLISKIDVGDWKAERKSHLMVKMMINDKNYVREKIVLKRDQDPALESFKVEFQFQSSNLLLHVSSVWTMQRWRNLILCEVDHSSRLRHI